MRCSPSPSMSIAVSAVIRPSRLLLFFSSILALVLLCVACLLWLRLAQIIPDHSRLLLAATCAISACVVFCSVLSNRKTFRLDISGTGQILLTHTRSSAAASHSQASGASVNGGSEVVHLLENATLWPTFMLLRLQAPSGRVTVLPVLPDCLDRNAFCAVLVACRWLATQTLRDAAKPNKKIPLVD